MIESGVRCDLVFYGGSNMSGKRSVVRVFPGGNRQGDVRGRDIKSLVVRAPYGTRVILAAHDGLDWQGKAWRCLRVLESSAVAPAKASGLPGVRVPDVDLYAEPTARKSPYGLERSYRYVDSLDEGEDWTFGRGGGLRGCVSVIRVARELPPEEHELSAAERVVRRVLTRAASHHPSALRELTEVAAKALAAELVVEGVADAGERARYLSAWAEGLGHG